MNGTVAAMAGVLLTVVSVIDANNHSREKDGWAPVTWILGSLLVGVWFLACAVNAAMPVLSRSWDIQQVGAIENGAVDLHVIVDRISYADWIVTYAWPMDAQGRTSKASAWYPYDRTPTARRPLGKTDTGILHIEFDPSATPPTSIMLEVKHSRHWLLPNTSIYLGPIKLKADK